MLFLVSVWQLNRMKKAHELRLSDVLCFIHCCPLSAPEANTKLNHLLSPRQCRKCLDEQVIISTTVIFLQSLLCSLHALLFKHPGLPFPVLLLILSSSLMCLLSFLFFPPAKSKASSLFLWNLFGINCSITSPHTPHTPPLQSCLAYELMFPMEQINHRLTAYQSSDLLKRV